MGLRGAIRGKPVRTTVADKAACPLDRVNRQFRADRPNQLWVSDFTYVSTWQGFVYVAFVIDVFARRIVGWRVSSSMQTDFVLDALEQALYSAGQPSEMADWSITATGFAIRLHPLHRAAGRSRHRAVGGQHGRQLRQRVGRDHQRSVQGRTHPPAGTMEVLRSRRMATLEWVDWFNHHRLLEPIGYIPPAEAEQRYHDAVNAQSLFADGSCRPMLIGMLL